MGLFFNRVLSPFVCLEKLQNAEKLYQQSRFNSRHRQRDHSFFFFPKLDKDEVQDMIFGLSRIFAHHVCEKESKHILAKIEHMLARLIQYHFQSASAVSTIIQLLSEFLSCSSFVLELICFPCAVNTRHELISFMTNHHPLHVLVIRQAQMGKLPFILLLPQQAFGIKKTI